MPAMRRFVRRPPRWLFVVAWLTIAVHTVVAAGFLVARQPADRFPGDRTPAPRSDIRALLHGSAPSGHRIDANARAAAVRKLLQQRSRALLRRDRTAFLATIAPSADALRSRQVAFFANIAQVPLATWRYELEPDRQTVLPPGVSAAYGEGAWAPAMRLRYALRGYETGPTSQERWYLFARHGERWYLADDGLSPWGLANHGEGSVANLWDFGPVATLSTPSALVLGHPGMERLMRSVLSIATRAAPAVSDVWDDWRSRVVVLTPGDTDELAQLLEEPGDLSRMAAFASADVAGAGPPAGKRVLINPDVFGKLSPYGRQVVLTHEITHVATRHVTSAATPHWLAEGFADYVAYRSVDAEPTSAARELAHQVRAGELPDRLPAAADFRPDNPHLSQVYQQSWLACRLIAERTDQATLVRLYHRLSGDGGDPQRNVEHAFREELGMGVADFVALWRQYLEKLLEDT